MFPSCPSLNEMFKLTGTEKWKVMFAKIRAKVMEKVRTFEALGRAALNSKHMGDGDVIKTVVLVVIGFFIAAILFPPAISAIDTMNTNPVVNGAHVNFNPAVVTVAEVLMPVLAVIAVALYFMPRLRGE